MDAASKGLLLAFPVFFVLSAFFSDADLAFISSPKAGSNPVAHVVYSG